jgi:hypothetical protein
VNVDANTSMAGLHPPAALTAFGLWGFRATTVEVVASRFMTSTSSAADIVVVPGRLRSAYASLTRRALRTPLGL